MNEGLANCQIVVNFPKERIVRVPVPDNMKQQIRKNQKNHINKMIEEQANLLACRLSMNGVDISTEDFQKSFALTIECLRAAIYNTVGLSHPMQRPMQEMIDEIEIIIKHPKN